MAATEVDGELLIQDLGPDLIDRGDCESDINPALDGEEGFYWLSTHYDTTFERDDSDKYVGSYSWKITTPFGENGSVALAEDRPNDDMKVFEVGKTYLLKAAMKADNYSNSRLSISYRKDNEWHTLGTPLAPSGADTWEEVEGEFTIPEGAVAATLVLTQMSTSSYVSIDCLELYEIGEVYLEYDHGIERLTIS